MGRSGPVPGVGSCRWKRRWPGRLLSDRVRHRNVTSRDSKAGRETNDLIRPRKIKTTGGSILKVREIIKVIEDDGWYLVATKGSHRQFKHKEKPGRITIA